MSASKMPTSVNFAAEELKNQQPTEFIFLNRMHSPVKKIQKKHRYQVLMRLKSYALLEKIYDIAVKILLSATSPVTSSPQ